MQQFSEKIGAIAAALARAQAELMNHGTILTAQVKLASSWEKRRNMRNVSMVADLNKVRKALNRQEIATIQSPLVENGTGKIHLTTLLAHVSGEWISSDWPVCALKDIELRCRTGEVFTSAQRDALFVLIGIPGDDDLAASDLADSVRSPAEPQSPGDNKVRPAKSGSIRRLQNEDVSVALCDVLPGEGSAFSCQDRPEKTRSVADHALAPEVGLRVPSYSIENIPAQDTARLAFPKEPARKRSKEHLSFVRGHPCLVCKQSPSDAHHLKFSQPKMLGRKVSDEFTVPLCRMHHQDLHRHGNEKAWWADQHIAPLAIANELWAASQARLGHGGEEPYVTPMSRDITV